MIFLFLIPLIIAFPTFHQKKLQRLFMVLSFEVEWANGVFFFFLVLSFEFIDILFCETYNFTTHFKISRGFR